MNAADLEIARLKAELEEARRDANLEIDAGFDNWAPLQAENEKLRAELSRLTEENRRARVALKLAEWAAYSQEGPGRAQDVERRRQRMTPERGKHIFFWLSGLALLATCLPVPATGARALGAISLVFLVFDWRANR